jgi:hypothetical protein
MMHVLVIMRILRKRATRSPVIVPRIQFRIDLKTLLTCMSLTNAISVPGSKPRLERSRL